MSNKQKSVKRKKFRKITFKFSKQEYEVLEKCAQLESTTINKFVKRNIRNGIEVMMPRLKVWLDQQQPENQLTFFADNPEDNVMKPTQTSMVEEYEEFYDEDTKNHKE